MIYFNALYTDEEIVKTLKHRACSGVLDGTNTLQNKQYNNYCSGHQLKSGITFIFTRDVGMHSCGWWKNPDYERCYHLSLSFRHPLTNIPVPHVKKVANLWVDRFYGDDKNKIWCEPPYSREGKILDVWHYRLFCNPAWEAILPRKEVYTKEFTERGWKSWSEVNDL